MEEENKQLYKTKVAMRTLLFLTFVCILNVGYGQVCATCAPKGIKTDPINSFQNAVNAEKPSKRNTFFDWTNLGLFNVNAQGWAPPFNQTQAPFNQSGNAPLFHFIDNPDRLSQDGWELIKYDLGYYENGLPKTTLTKDIYIVLYNRFTGIMRVFVAINEPVAFTGVKIRVKFNNGFKTNLLSNSSKIFALDNFEANPAINSVAEYRPSKWAYADFHMSYDPCTCYNQSAIQVNISYITNSVLTLTGNLTGSITPSVTSISSGAGSVSQDGYTFSDMVSDGVKAKKSFDDVNGLVGGLVKADASNIPALNQLKTDINSSSFLSGTLKSLPYFNAALTLVDFLTGGGKKSSSPQEVKVMPMTMRADIKMSGSLETSFPFPDITFYTPGSSNVACLDIDQYPYYNEVLGTFNLLTTPKMDYTISDGTPFFIFANVRLAEDIEYVLNPAAGFDPSKTEIMGNIIFKNPDQSIRHETGYYPIGALRQIQVMTYPVNPELRLLVKLVRQDATPNTQSVLLAATYPVKLNNCFGCTFPEVLVPAYSVSQSIEITNSRSNYNVAVPPQNTITIKAGGAILPNSTLAISYRNLYESSTYKSPASSSIISSFCSSSVYTTPNRSLRQKEDENSETEIVADNKESFTAYPNPAKDNIIIQYSIEIETKVMLNIADLSGRTIATPVNEYLTPGNYETAFDITNLNAGDYIYTLQTNQGKQTKRFAVIK